VMYMTLVGKEPFVGANVLDTMYRRTVEDAKPFASINPQLNCPEALEAIVFKALARDVADRYQTMLEVKTELERLVFTLA